MNGTRKSSPACDLRALPPRERLEAIASTLPFASPEEAVELAQFLIQLVHPDDQSPVKPLVQRLLRTASGSEKPLDATDVLARLVPIWSAIAKPAQAVILDGCPAETKAAPVTISETAPPESILGFVQDFRRIDLSGSLVPYLAASDTTIARAAERVLVGFAMGLLGSPNAATVGREFATLAIENDGSATDHQTLITALLDAAWTFDTHERRNVILALLILAAATPVAGMQAEPWPRFHRLLTEHRHLGSVAMQRAIRRAPIPILRAAAWRWMAHDGFSRAAVERVAWAASRDEHVALLRSASLSLRPVRRAAAALADVRSTLRKNTLTIADDAPLPDPRLIASLPITARRHLPRMLGVFSMSPQVRRLLAEPLLTDRDPSIRHAAARAADGPDLIDYTFDEHESVARSAALRRSSVGLTLRWPPRQADAARLTSWTKLERAPHASVRRIAREDAQRAHPFKPGSPVSRAAARRWLAEDPSTFVESMRHRIREASEHAKIQTIVLARQLSLIHLLERDLVLLLEEGGSSRLRATIAATLDQYRSSAGDAWMNSLIEDNDPRVQSNACEAWHRAIRTRTPSSGEPIGRFAELKSHGHHRVRATAVRELLRAEAKHRGATYDAAITEGLRALLVESRPDHRLAGMWVATRCAEQLRRDAPEGAWTELAHNIAHAAQTDTDERVRQRAGHAANTWMSVIERSAMRDAAQGRVA